MRTRGLVIVVTVVLAALVALTLGLTRPWIALFDHSTTEPAHTIVKKYYKLGKYTGGLGLDNGVAPSQLVAFCGQMVKDRDVLAYFHTKDQLRSYMAGCATRAGVE